MDSYCLSSGTVISGGISSTRTVVFQGHVQNGFNGRDADNKNW